MFWEAFYLLGRGMHVRYRYSSIMLLRHDLIIRQIYVDGGRGSVFLDILNRIFQWPGVGRPPTIYGRVIMSQVQWRWKYAIRMTNIYS